MDNIMLNLGSGQRPFKPPFLNWDIQEDKFRQATLDAGCLWLNEELTDGSCAMIVLHHCLEHFGCGEADGLVSDCFRWLKPDGSLLIFVPDMRALAQRWLTHQMDTQLYMTNVYGAYLGDVHDRHFWGYDFDSLHGYLRKWNWAVVTGYKSRHIPGADIAQDFWILGMECVK